MRNIITALVVTTLVATAVAGDDEVDTRALYAEALRCEHDGRAADARKLYQRVLAEDADHAAARRALGYVRVDDAWLTKEAARKQLAIVVGGAEKPKRSPARPVKRDAFDRLVEALKSRSVATRVRAAKALGRTKDERALPYLVKRWERSSGNAPRSYFAQITQRSYLQDFDVEVA